MADRLLCVGSYTSETGGTGPGLTVLREDRTSGTTTTVAELETPGCSWLAWHPRLPVGYAVNELATGGITAFTVNADGTPRVLAVLESGGALPCHLAVTPDGRHALAAHYGSGSAAVFALDERGLPTGRTDLVELTGSGPDPERQEAPHAHMVTLNAAGTLASVLDLGSDTVWSYRLTPDGRLTDRVAARLPAGCGPRQLVRAAGDRAYLVAELSGELVTLREPTPGHFEVVHRTRASARPEENLSAQFTPAPDGRFGYFSNRGPDTLTVFALDDSAAPTVVTEYPLGAAWPRHFTVHGDRLYAASQFDDVLVTLDLDQETGVPTEAHRHPVNSPVFVSVVPTSTV
ncbi:beta-propeller fold lactonase family protein [Streptomyces sp. DSM 44915]|uniref:Beta-propeller fold lactonase family protein n=1 Tax=Streptomyces chisholmiae TaxID=3075540 RepID=A0ABU2JXS6_9ACTN|nr:beta-propeller fold lactonase family protein [Streptomyces sp. DSM 44915]MDT0269747.1 beta-propeller fold lactonase family protein [Streptomyces sp. DSM 44915]